MYTALGKHSDVEGRLTDLELRFNRYVKLLMVPHSAPPSVIEEGLLVRADGTNWNPGYGPGIYQWRVNEWVKVG